MIINAFEGAITVTEVAPNSLSSPEASSSHSPTRAFDFAVIFSLTHPHLVRLASASKPPLHFHPYQEEYLTVTHGALGFEIEGKECVLTPADGEICVPPWANHRLYPLLPRQGQDDGAKVEFLLSGEDTKDAFRLDAVFFQNWYGYQDDVVVGGKALDLVQVMNMFDAGGSYLSFPTWLPFSKRLAQITGIVIGRWIGSLLGYQPFYKKWTRDWHVACDKMESSLFMRRFADRVKQE